MNVMKVMNRFCSANYFKKDVHRKCSLLFYLTDGEEIFIHQLIIYSVTVLNLHRISTK